MKTPDHAFLESLMPNCRTRCSFAKTGTTWSIFIEPGEVTQVAKAMWEEGYFLEDIVCVDIEEGYQILYHFDHWDCPGRMTFRTILPRDNPAIDSICGIYQGAEWHERESADFYGVTFVGNSNPRPLLLPEGMTVPPLRKDPAKRVPLLKMIPFCKVEDFPQDHPLAKAREAGEGAQKEGTQKVEEAV
jgi:NADH-quinone oxidoreductase subunit C